MIDIARDDAILKRSTFLLKLYEDKTMIGLVLISKKIEVLGRKRMLLFCLMENLQSHNSEVYQQNLWIINLEIIFGYNYENISGLRSEVVLRLGVFSEVYGSLSLFCEIEVVGFSGDENVASDNFRCLKVFDFPAAVLARGGGGKGSGGGSIWGGSGIWIGRGLIAWMIAGLIARLIAGAFGVGDTGGLGTVTE